MSEQAGGRLRAAQWGERASEGERERTSAAPFSFGNIRCTTKSTTRCNKCKRIATREGVISPALGAARPRLFCRFDLQEFLCEFLNAGQSIHSFSYSRLLLRSGRRGDKSLSVCRAFCLPDLEVLLFVLTFFFFNILVGLYILHNTVDGSCRNSVLAEKCRL